MVGGQVDGAEYNESQELENLLGVFNILVKKELGKITNETLHATLKKLKQEKLTMQMVEDMIWEVDEDCDGHVSWEEFKAMFYRVRHDKSGWEPRRLFNLVEFMMHDKVRVFLARRGRRVSSLPLPAFPPPSHLLASHSARSRPPVPGPIWLH